MTAHCSLLTFMLESVLIRGWESSTVELVDGLSSIQNEITLSREERKRLSVL